jgi:hypothetical protein
MRIAMLARSLAGLALLLAASTCHAGTVSGTVTNGTTGKPAAGVDVILIQLQGTMQPVAQTKTDENGHYELQHPALGQGPMLIRAVYRGVNYHEPATPGKSTVDVEVFEPTDKASSITVTAHAIVCQPDGPNLVVNEEYLISNKTDPPMAYYRADGSFVFSLPAGAQLGEVSAVGTSGMPVVQQPVDVGKDGHAVVFPFRPGDSSVRMAYRLPYSGNQAKIQFSSPYGVSRLAVFAPPSVQISGEGFTPAGSEQGLSVYMRESVAANTPVDVSVSGTAPPPVQGNASNEGGDDTQNPSVNSRAESGETPVANITTLPARIDDMKWIFVGGFAAIFALGLIYLLRQPKTPVVESASVVEHVAAPSASSSVSMNARTFTPEAFAQTGNIVPTNENGGSSALRTASQIAAASIEREVRGGLEELKDALFRLELRREAGTISEDEYSREHDRIQNLLRELVKG